MSEAEFLRLVCEIRDIRDPRILERPLEEVPLDSLDLLELRLALERRLGRCLMDDKFIASSTLWDLYKLVSQ